MTVPITPPPTTPVQPGNGLLRRMPVGGTAFVVSPSDEIIKQAAGVIYRVNNSRYGDFTSHNDTAQALAEEGLLVGLSANMLIKQLQDALDLVNFQRDAVRKLIDEATPSLSIPPVDCHDRCAYSDCVCSGKYRVQAWDLDPDAVRAALKSTKEA